jgi:hypothetical protein
MIQFVVEVDEDDLGNNESVSIRASNIRPKANARLCFSVLEPSRILILVRVPSVPRFFALQLESDLTFSISSAKISQSAVHSPQIFLYHHRRGPPYCRQSPSNPPFTSKRYQI